ncbi:NACHT domain-containing protein [Micromonospora sp. NPDC049497]|uniref:NACHT domain-containing protein n=1 Tax=Micromonospora sp. NPDC049497 TaxID=3364273 RepID=UPI0037A9ECC9
MGDYRLTQLGTSEFEHMSQSLLAALIGASNVKVYGVGRDGGRELTTDAVFEIEEGLQWSGYTVAQAKFRARPGSADANATWLRSQIRAELQDWISPIANRHPKPDNLLFISNVPLSAVPGHGLDAVEDVFGDFADRLPLKAYAVWHYDHVCRLLDSYPGVRAAYAGLLTSGDVLTELRQVLLGEVINIGEVLHRHAAKELVAEQWVRLGESGSRAHEKLQIGQVGVDLQALAAVGDTDPASRPIQVLEHMIIAGNGVLRPSIYEGPEPHRVLVGGPGQGKTTVGQLLCQIYRANLVSDLDSIGPQAAGVVTTLRQHLAASGLPIPINKRWPLRLDLSGYADVLGGNPATSVLRHLASQISDRGADTITAGQLKTWLSSWPWLLVLDGFDEVVAPQVREAMIDRIADFFIDAASVDADLMVIATTRPQGYSAEFSPDQYQHLHLMPLTSGQAEAFARKLADVRLGDDPDAHANVLARIGEAARDPLTARLMVTPLQVTIMSLLLEGRARVPQDRYTLFADYYRTIYGREVAKNTATARLLERHRRTVDQLHEKVGLRLQIQAESSGKADAALPNREVQTLARQILDKEDHPVEEAQRLAEQIAAAATTRLVLLVAKHADDVGFDVRSLQELMAARALTTGPDGGIMERLRAIALSAHWRNTFLLAAGRLATDRRHLVDAILVLLEDLDTSSYLTMYLHPAAGLALDLLDDKFAAPSPRVEMKLVRKAVEVLQSPPIVGFLDASDILQRAALTGSALLGPFIADVAKTSLAADPPQRITAAIMMRRWARGTGALAALGRQRTAGDFAEFGSDQAAVIRAHYLTRSVAPRVKGMPGQPRRGGAAANTGANRCHQTVAGYFRTGSEDVAVSAIFDLEDGRAWDDILQTFDGIAVTSVGSKPMPAIKQPRYHRATLARALNRPAVANHLAQRLLALDPDDWAVASTVADIIKNVLQSRPAGGALGS